MRQLLQLLIKIYQICLSPFLGQHCRFYPSCSHYAHDAVQSHGAVRGSWLAIKRLCKCHPWHEGGIDHVPELVEVKKSNKPKSQAVNKNLKSKN